MKNVIADRRLTQKGEEGRADSTLVHPPNTPIPHVQPRVGYICGLWVLPGRDNSQRKHAKADCAKFVIYNSVVQGLWWIKKLLKWFTKRVSQFMKETTNLFTKFLFDSFTSGSQPQINNRKIGKVNRFHNRIEPFPPLFWALGIVQYLRIYCTARGDPALRPGIPQQWYWQGTVRQGSVRFNLREEESPSTLFLSCCTYSMVITNL